MSTSELPPHELRGPIGTVASTSGGPSPTSVGPPSAITGGGPGLAAGAPTPVAAPPTVPSPDDPAALSRLVGQLAGELWSSSLVPVPLAPFAAAFAAASAPAPGSPGIAPQMIAAPLPGTEPNPTPVAPQSVVTGFSPQLLPTGASPASASPGASFGSVPSSPGSGPGVAPAFEPAGAPPTIPASAPKTSSVEPPAVPSSASLPSPYGPPTSVPSAPSTQRSSPLASPVFSDDLLRGLHPAGLTPFTEVLRIPVVDELDAPVREPAHASSPAQQNLPGTASVPSGSSVYGNAPLAGNGKGATGVAAPTNATAPVPRTSGATAPPSGEQPYQVPGATSLGSSSAGPSSSGGAAAPGSTNPFGSPGWDTSLGREQRPRIDTYEVRSDDALVRDLGGRGFDPYAVRRDFPILQERIRGRRLVWLDNAATTQKPKSVIDRISYFYEHENSNVHRAAHTLAARSTDAYEAGRESTRRFLNAPSTKEIVFARGATEAINLVAKSWGRRHVKEGDEIVVTWLEHHANIVPWQQLCAETGARLRVAPVDDRGDVILEEYEKLFGPRTRIASITQVSNALGTITPTREMVQIARRYGATVLVDGAQAVSHMKVDVQDLDCDFYVFSGHKVFAPTGIGVLYGKREVLEAMPPWQGGGNMIADVTFEKTTYQPPPGRFEAGTGSIADAVGLGAALDYVMAIGMETIDRYEHELLVYATEQLLTIPGLRIYGTAPRKAGVLSFTLDGHRTEDMGSALDQEGIAVRSGHHCAQPILRRFGLEASVRASLAFYNVCEDIDALVAALRRLAPGKR